MKENEVIVKRQKCSTRFKNGDMDFMFNWTIGVSQIIGMSPFCWLPWLETRLQRGYG